MKTNFTYRVNDNLFRVVGKDVQYYQPDLANELNGIGGLWKSLKKLAKPLAIGAGVYLGYKTIKKSGGLSHETIAKAASIGSSYINYRARMAQQKLQEQGIDTQGDNQQALTAQDFMPTNQPIDHAQYLSPSLDLKTLMLFGGGALLFISAIKG